LRPRAGEIRGNISLTTVVEATEGSGCWRIPRRDREAEPKVRHDVASSIDAVVTSVHVVSPDDGFYSSGDHFWSWLGQAQVLDDARIDPSNLADASEVVVGRETLANLFVPIAD
jgi:hypothetical protein